MGITEVYRQENANNNKKYKFYIKKTEFYRFIIKLRQLSINLKKIKAVVN